MLFWCNTPLHLHSHFRTLAQPLQCLLFCLLPSRKKINIMTAKTETHRSMGNSFSSLQHAAALVGCFLTHRQAVYKWKLLRSKKQKCKQFKFIIVNALFPARSKVGKHQWSAREYNLHFVARGIVLMGPMKTEDSFLAFFFSIQVEILTLPEPFRDSALFAPFCADTSHTKMTLVILLCRTWLSMNNVFR